MPRRAQDQRQPPRRYLVEWYLPGLTVDAARRDEASIRAASRSLTAEGRLTRYLGATFVPSEGTLLAVFEADDAAFVVDANRRAGVPVDRIVDVVDGRGAGRMPRQRAAASPPPAMDGAPGLESSATPTDTEEP